MIDQREEDGLDELLRGHLTRELDRQLGRAERRFASVAAPASPRGRSASWTALTTLAAAACGALFWVLLAARQQSTVPRDGDVQAHASGVEPRIEAGLVELERTLVWQTLDEGTLVVDDGDRPLRKLRLRSLERVQWYDPVNQALVEATVPKEEIIFVGMQTY
jgi:hypothetical protein